MRIPKFTRHATGQARVRIKGKDYYLGVHGTPEAEARYRQLVAELVSGTPAKPAPAESVTVSCVVAAYLEHLDRTLSATSREPAQYSFAVRPLVDLFGPENACEFSPKKLKLLQVEMVRRDWCRNVVNHRTNRIRTIFRWAESEELVPPGTAHSLATVRPIPRTYPGVRNTDPVRPSSREDLDRVTAELRKRSPRAAVMLELQWLAGMRSCEVRIMRAGDVARAGEVWLYRPERAKTDYIDGHAPRVIPLGPECQKLLTPILAAAKPEAYLFPSRRAPLYTACGYDLVVRKACERIGVKIIPYGGRHSAKARIARVAGLDAARAVLGHSSVEMTAHYAAEQDLDLAIETARKLG